MLKRLMSFLIFFGLFSASYAESDEVLPTNYPPFVGINHTEYGTGVYGSSNNTPWNGFIGMTSAGSNTVTTSANCSADPLRYEGQEQNSGTYYFQAQWSPNHYDVEYNSGSCDGDGITDAGAAIYGEDYQIKSLQNSGVTEPDGYKFTGWVGTSVGLYNGSNTPYSNLAEGLRKYAETGTVSPYLIEGDLTLTALCEAIPYHIRYDCDCNTDGCSGNAPTDDNSYYVTSDNVIVLANPDNNGCAWDEHEFQGWDCFDTSNNLVSNHLDYLNQANQVIANWPASNVTCRANWSGEQHHIYYTCGKYGPNSVSVDGTPPTDSTLYYTRTTHYELAQDATGCEVPNGYHFTGWNCDKNIDDGNGQMQYNANEQTGLVSQSGTYNVNGNTTCDAMWNNNQIKLKWQSGASGVTMPDGLSYSCFYESGTINVKKPTRPGYTFVGWKVIGHCYDGDECPNTWPAE